MKHVQWHLDHTREYLNTHVNLPLIPENPQHKSSRYEDRLVPALIPLMQETCWKVLETNVDTYNYVLTFQHYSRNITNVLELKYLITQS